MKPFKGHLDALGEASRAWQAGCFAEFGAAIIRRKEKREKRAAQKNLQLNRLQNEIPDSVRPSVFFP